MSRFRGITFTVSAIICLAAISPNLAHAAKRSPTSSFFCSISSFFTGTPCDTAPTPTPALETKRAPRVAGTSTSAISASNLQSQPKTPEIVTNRIADEVKPRAESPISREEIEVIVARAVAAALARQKSAQPQQSPALVYQSSGGNSSNLADAIGKSLIALREDIASGAIPVSNGTVSGSFSGTLSGTANLSTLAVSGIPTSAIIGSAPFGATSAGGLVVRGNYAYYANDIDGKLYITDISKPSTPTIVSSISVTSPQNCTNKLNLSGRYAIWASDCLNHFYVIDISNAASPTIINSVTVNAAPYTAGGLFPGAADISGRYLFIGGLNSGYTAGHVSITDISNPVGTTMASQTSFSIPGNYVEALQVVGRYMYVYGSTQLKIFDISDVSNPINVGNVTVDAAADGMGNLISIKGRYAYLAAAGASKIDVVDVSDPSSPSLVGSVSATGVPKGIQVQDHYAYVAQSNGVAVYDVSNASSPTYLGSLSSTPAHNIAISGRYAVTTAGEIINLGGAYIQQLEVGGILTDSLHVRQLARFENSVDVMGSISVGAGGLFSSGPVGIASEGGGSNVLSVSAIGTGQTTGKTNSFDAVAVSNLATSSTASITKSGIKITSTGSWAGTNATNIGLLVSSVTGGTKNFDAIFNGGGNVGIGTTSPSAKFSLTASGTGTGRALAIADSSNSEKFTVLDNGLVGIGTTNPTAKLDIEDASNSGIFLGRNGNDHFVYIQSGAPSGYTANSFAIWNGVNSAWNGLIMQFDSNTLLRFNRDIVGAATQILGNNASAAALTVSQYGAGNVLSLENAINSPVFTVTNVGSVGIGTSSPYSKLSVAGQVVGQNFVATSSTVGFQASNLLGGATTLSTDAQGNIIRTPSDVNLKENILPLTGSLDKVKLLRGVSYQWKDKERFGTSTEIGFIAQEVEPIVPEAVKSGGTYKSLNYGNLVALVVEAMKELANKIEALALSLKNFVADSITAHEVYTQKITTDMLCVGSTCVNEGQFRELLNRAGSSYSAVTPSAPPPQPAQPDATTTTPEPTTSSSTPDVATSTATTSNGPVEP